MIVAMQILGERMADSRVAGCSLIRQLIRGAPFWPRIDQASARAVGRARCQLHLRPSWIMTSRMPNGESESHPAALHQ
jgi:hypothetical protein